MNVFTRGAIKQASSDYRDAAQELQAWSGVVKRAAWQNFVELRADFPKADDVDGVIVFNIRHNRYRMLTVVKYDRFEDGRHINGSVYVKAFMTHAEYDRWSVLSEQQREKTLWQQS